MSDKPKKAAKAAKLAKDKMACNKPRTTPNHPTKSHVVLAKGDGCSGGKVIRFGQQGVRGAGKNPKTKKEIRFDKKVEEWRRKLGQVLVSPFNRTTWSKV